MKQKNKFYHELSLRYCIPQPVIETICNSPFQFTKRAIERLDQKPIMFTYLGKIKIKKNILNKLMNEEHKL